MTRKSFLKFLLAAFIVFLFFVVFILFAYIKILPSLVQNLSVITKIENILYDTLKIDAEINQPILKTNFSPNINFSISQIRIEKENRQLFYAKNFDINLSLKNIFSKEIIINKLGTDDLFVDVNNLISAFVSDKQQQEKTTNNWSFNIFNALLYLKNSVILYEIEKGTLAKIIAKNLEVDNSQKEQRFLHFDFIAEIFKNNESIVLKFADDNKVYFKDNHFYIKKCPLFINNSKVFFDLEADKKQNFDVLVYSNKFLIKDIIELLQTNIIANNINDILVFFNNLKGDFNFAFKLNNSGFNGDIKINNANVELIPLANIPVKITNGHIKLNEKDVILSDFKGFYDNKKVNFIELSGTVKDYLKSLDTNIEIRLNVTNDFTEKYLSKLACAKIQLLGNAVSKVIIKSVYNKFDIWAAGKISKGDDILIENMSLSPIDYDRALQTDLHFENNILNIKNISYYIASQLTQGANVKPILTLSGNFDIIKNKLLDMGFNIPQPLPSEFLNIIVGQKLFKKGQFWGNFHYWDNKTIPYLQGNLVAEKIIIPSQRLFLKKGKISTTDNLLNISAEGSYRRTKYNLDGKFNNQIIFPIIVKDMNLSIGKIDIDRMLKSMNSSVSTNNKEIVTEINSEEDIATDEGAPTFDLSNLIIEKASLFVEEGNYKEINFDNVQATLTLDKENKLQVKSNRFNIAQGTSSILIDCDLKNHIYNLFLGVKDVNSDIMSSTILNLPGEISGKASGIIKLNSDEKLNLNGLMKFSIKDGQIQKIGLVEYVLNVASLFRNPVVMFSPATFSEIVNIPDGKFNTISGEIKLKDNNIELMKIKSQSPLLSAYIVGCYNLVNNDAILRIYTKHGKNKNGLSAFFRNFSLQNLANQIPLNKKNDENYYAAELEQIPPVDGEEKDVQIFLTKIDGNILTNNFLSSLKKIK